MTYFQNPFTSDFEGSWLLADRHHSPKFVCPRNAGRGEEIVVAWNAGPYDLSGTDSDGTNATDSLQITFAMNNTTNWNTIEVDLTTTASSSSAVTSEEIVSALNDDAIFNDWFEAYLGPPAKTNGFSTRRVNIKQKKPVTNFKFYINNGKAEEVIRFNERSGVTQLPSYFSRHTIDNRFAFTDSANMIIELDPSSAVDAAVINDAKNFKGISLNLDSSSVSEDWALLEGRSGLFTFRKNSFDGSGRTSAVIEYPAGAKVGDFAKKIIYSYTGAATSPTTMAEIPYVLVSGDLITP